MQVYDLANQLAKEIRESEEFRQYKKIKQEIDMQPELKQKIDAFEKLRYDIQILSIKGEQVIEEKNKKLQEMYTILIQNMEIKKYFDLEIKFNIMLADVNKIIAEAVKDVL